MIPTGAFLFILLIAGAFHHKIPKGSSPSTLLFATSRRKNDCTAIRHCCTASLDHSHCHKPECARNFCVLRVTLILTESKTKADIQQHRSGDVRRGATRREPSVRGQRANWINSDTCGRQNASVGEQV